MGCEVVTVSTDTEFVHLAWQRHEKELQHVKYPMGSDRTGQLARAFGVYDEASGHALRGTFIVNPEGKLLNAEVNYYNLGRNVQELLRKFKANVYLARKAGEACPSKWNDEGDATLRPSAQMVGRVHEALEGQQPG
jgi:NADH-dependent peroxiredoxin subunit C